MVQRLTYRRHNRYNTRSNKTRVVRLPGGTHILQNVQKTTNIPKCGDCKKPLQGVPAIRPVKLARIARHKRRVSRPYGGSRCHKCVRARIVRAFLLEEQKCVKAVLQEKEKQKAEALKKTKTKKVTKRRVNWVATWPTWWGIEATDPASHSGFGISTNIGETLQMASIRPCVAEDIFAMQDCNTANLPENYQMKNDECELRCHGHITSIAVSRPERKQGIAQQLLRATHTAMQKCFCAEYSSLHVRVSNRAAYSLYSYLGYKKHELEKMYYSDKEDALSLHCLFPYGEEQNAQRQEKKQARTHRVPGPTTNHPETTVKTLDITTSTLPAQSQPDAVSSPTEEKQEAKRHHGKIKKNKKKK